MTYINYNLTNMSTSGNGLLNFIAFTSSQTDFVAGWILFSVFYLIIIFVLKRTSDNFTASFAMTSLVMAVLTWLLYAVKICSGYNLVISLALIPISIILLFAMD